MPRHPLACWTLLSPHLRNWKQARMWWVKRASTRHIYRIMHFRTSRLHSTMSNCHKRCGSKTSRWCTSPWLSGYISHPYGSIVHVNFQLKLKETSPGCMNLWQKTLGIKLTWIDSVNSYACHVSQLNGSVVVEMWNRFCLRGTPGIFHPLRKIIIYVWTQFDH